MRSLRRHQSSFVAGQCQHVRANRRSRLLDRNRHLMRSEQLADISSSSGLAKRMSARSSIALAPACRPPFGLLGRGERQDGDSLPRARCGPCRSPALRHLRQRKAAPLRADSVPAIGRCHEPPWYGPCEQARLIGCGHHDEIGSVQSKRGRMPAWVQPSAPTSPRDPLQSAPQILYATSCTTWCMRAAEGRINAQNGRCHWAARLRRGHRMLSAMPTSKVRSGKTASTLSSPVPDGIAAVIATTSHRAPFRPSAPPRTRSIGRRPPPGPLSACLRRCRT